MNEQSERNKSLVAKLGKGATLGMFLGLLLAEFSENRVLGYGIGLCCGVALGIVFADEKTVQPRKFSELSDGEKKIRIMLIALGVFTLVAGVAVFFLAIK
ncbi:MAG: hypothetical protein GY755_00905 [Chloroflexi bacterium]|nr:hypothetical protein [Chloroflexota bacterium]